MILSVDFPKKSRRAKSHAIQIANGKLSSVATKAMRKDSVTIAHSAALRIIRSVLFLELVHLQNLALQIPVVRQSTLWRCLRFPRAR